MGYKAVIFDLDNTLIEVPPEFVNTLLKQTLSEFNLNHSSEYAGRFWIDPNRNQVIEDHFKLNPDLFWKVYKRYDTIELRRRFAKPYDDISFLSELRKKKYKTGIVTVSPKHITDFEISLLNQELDAIIIARDDNGLKFKPSPDGLEECLRVLEVDNQEALYVGDSDEDLVMARTARVPFALLVRKDELEQHRHLKEIPSLMIGNLYTLRKIIY